MIVRHYEERDLDALRRMHRAQGFAYDFPDLSDPTFFLKGVLEEDGRPRMAGLLRLTAEAYLLADPSDGEPRQRLGWLLALHEAMRKATAAQGLGDVFAQIPPEINKRFGKRLQRLGWVQSPAWPLWARRLL